MANNATLSEPSQVRPAVTGVAVSVFAASEVAWSAAALDGLHCTEFSTASVTYQHAVIGAITSAKYMLAAVHQSAVPVIRFSTVSEAVAVDSTASAVDKTQTENVGVVGVVGASVARTVRDSVDSGEHYGAAVDKRAAETVDFTDSTTCKFERGLVDSAQSVAMMYSEFVRIASDSVDSGEHYGAAVDKRASETVDFTDNTACKFKRGLVDSAQSVAMMYSEFVRIASDPVGTADFTAIVTQKTAQEVVAVGEDSIAHATKGVPDVVATADSTATHFIKCVLDIVEMSEIVVLQEVQTASSCDTAVAADYSAIGFSKTVSEVLAVSDVVGVELLASSSAGFGDINFGLSGFGG